MHNIGRQTSLWLLVVITLSLASATRDLNAQTVTTTSTSTTLTTTSMTATTTTTSTTLPAGVACSGSCSADLATVDGPKNMEKYLKKLFAEMKKCAKKADTTCPCPTPKAEKIAVELSSECTTLLSCNANRLFGRTLGNDWDVTARCYGGSAQSKCQKVATGVAAKEALLHFKRVRTNKESKSVADLAKCIKKVDKKCPPAGGLSEVTCLSALNLRNIASLPMSCEQVSTAYTPEQIQQAVTNAAAALGLPLDGAIFEDPATFAALMAQSAAGLGCYVPPLSESVPAAGGRGLDLRLGRPRAVSLPTEYCGPGTSDEHPLLAFFPPGVCLNSVCAAHDSCYGGLAQNKCLDTKACMWSQLTSTCDGDFSEGYTACLVGDECNVFCKLIGGAAAVLSVGQIANSECDYGGKYDCQVCVPGAPRGCCRDRETCTTTTTTTTTAPSTTTLPTTTTTTSTTTTTTTTLRLGITQLTTGVGNVTGLTISADGSTVAFASAADLTGENPGLVSQVFTVRTNGTNLTQAIAPPPASTNCGEQPTAKEPSLTADGTLLGYSALRWVQPFYQGHLCDDWIYAVVVPDGAELLLPFGDYTDAPSVSADGSLIAFLRGGPRVVRDTWIGDPSGLVTSFRVTSGRGAPLMSGNGQRIVDAQYSGIQVRDVVPDAVGSLVASTYPNSLATDYTAQQVVFTSTYDPFGENTDGSYEVFLWQDGIGVEQLTHTVSGVTSATISGDGHTVAFSFDGDLYTLDVASRDFTRVVDVPTNYTTSSPRVSYDGTRIVFVSNADLTGQNPSLASEIFIVVM